MGRSKQNYFIMKQNYLFGAAIMVVMFLASCGDGTTKKKITLDFPSEISGGLSDYFEITNAVIKINKDGEKINKMIISIELQRNDTELPFDGENVGHQNLSNGWEYPSSISFSVDLFDEDGMPITTGFDEGCNYDEELALLTLKSGEKQWIQYNLNYNWALEFDEVMTIKKVEVNSNLHLKSSDNMESSSSETYSSSNSSSNKKSVGNEDWDELLKDYDNYMKQYVKLMKKANEGDMSAMTEYISFMEKANEVSTKISAAGNDISVSQLAEFNKIQLKYATKIANLAK